MLKLLEIYKIPIDEHKWIYTMPAPIDCASNDFFAEDLKQIGVDTVVSLLSSKEIVVHNLTKEQITFEETAIEYINFPITDFGVPADNDAFVALVNLLIKKIDNGQHIAIHCKAGIGRSSLLAAAILIHYGHETSAVFAHISNFRGVQVPDKLSQIQWISDNLNLFA